jgi:hypothetical protein
VDGPANGCHGGMGLGLAISRQLLPHLGADALVHRLSSASREKHGRSVTLAQEGSEAVAPALRQTFDLFSGHSDAQEYDATASIRESERRSRQRTLNLALTVPAEKSSLLRRKPVSSVCSC